MTTKSEMLERMTANLIEAHMDEYGDNHCCSYCRDTQEAREMLAGLGCDVSALTPE